MNRYSMLWGTTANGEYRLMWNSKKLADFLGSVGATDPSKAADTAQNILRSFGNYQEYAEQPIDDKPVSVHYAPMHLYKLPEFPGSMKPFCAWSVTGAENRPGGRNSTYSHTVLFPYEMMLGADKTINYLDLLFGTKLLTWQAVKAFREKTAVPAFDAAPDKVSVDFSDIKLAIISAATLIEGKGEKNLVIRLEKNCSFNTRAFALLTQIYSLLPPKLATESGFATYHAVENIAEISSKNSICVFVLPASAELKSLGTKKAVVLDLAEADGNITLQQSPLTETLLMWSKLSCDKRCAAYTSVFEDAPAYLDGDMFVQKSKSFFTNVRSYEEWLASAKEGSIGSLQDIQSLFSAHKEWTQIPWYKDQLRLAMPGLMPKGVKYSSLLNAVVTDYQFAQDETERRNAGELYRVGSQFGEVDIPRLCTSIASRQNSVSEAGFLPKLQAAEARYQSLEQTSREELLAQKNSYEERAQKTQEAYETRITTMQSQHIAELSAQKAAAEKEKVEACAAAEERLKKAEEVFRQMKGKLADQEAQLQSGVRALTLEKQSHAETKKHLADAEESEREMHHALESAEHRISRLGGWPRFLTKMPWWLPLVAALLIGAMIVGAVWVITTFGSSEEAPKTEAVTTELPIESQAPVATEEPTEVVTEIPETTESEQPIPNFAYNDWSNPETARQLQFSVPSIKMIKTGSDLQALCPGALEGYTVLALLSTDEAEEAAPATDESATDQTQETPSEPSDSAQPADAQPVGTENYALLLSRSDDAKDVDLLLLKEPGLVMQLGNRVVLAYGSDEMLTAAVAVLQTAIAGNAAVETETPADTAEPANQMMMYWIAGENSTVDIGKAMTEMTGSFLWWNTVKRISTDEEDLRKGQAELNSYKVPVLCIETDATTYYTYDYRDDMQKLPDFVVANDDRKNAVVGGFVLIDAATFPQE